MSTAGWRFLDVGKGLAYATSMVRPLLIAFCLGTLASLASQGHAAPANRTAMKAKKAKAKKAKIPRREGRPTRKVERALHPVKPPKTEVQRYRLGEGPAKTVIFLHGLGGEPGGPMMRACRTTAYLPTCSPRYCEKFGATIRGRLFPNRGRA